MDGHPARWRGTYGMGRTGSTVPLIVVEEVVSSPSREGERPIVSGGIVAGCRGGGDPFE